MAGKVIQELRKAMRVTQEEFGHALGIDPTTISRYENGKPVLREHWKLIAKELKKRIEEKNYHH